MEDIMKNKTLLVGIISLIVLSSCASSPKNKGPIDRGTYPAGFSASRAVVLYIHENVGVFGVDNDKVSWKNKDQRPQHVNIESGLRVFQVEYNDGKLMSSSRVSLAAMLENGESYLLKPVTDEGNVSFSIVTYRNGQEGEDATLYLNHLGRN
jgi:hypothetical protein